MLTNHTPGTISLFLLGPCQIEQHGRSLTLSRRKTAALLAYLALHPGPQPREQIAGLLWGQASDKDARRTLRVILSEARKLLGEDVFIGDRHTVGLNPATLAAVDIHRFFALTRHPTATPTADLEAALNLVRGELLAGLYDEWVLPLREQVNTLWLTATLTLIARYRTAGDYPRAIQHARNLLQREPAVEQAHQHLIFCLAASGDDEAALRQVTACRVALQKHLDVPLSPQTQALADSIQKHSPETAARLTNLPRPPTAFMGREDELNEIQTRLTHTRLLTLVGSAGSGKTRLAIQTADEIAFHYPDGVWWVDLTILTEPSLVLPTIAKILGVQERGGENLLPLTIQFIAAQHLLIVLDNCEHLLGACAHTVAALLPHCPGLVFLATSREPLDLPGELLWQTPTLPLPQPGSDWKTMQKSEAVRLFAARARTANGNFQLDEQNTPLVAEICRRLAGIPLALELAAAQLNSLSLAELWPRLGQTLDLSTAEPSPHTRRVTLRATIQWGYELLTPFQQMLFRRLTTFRGGWTLTAACAAAGYADPQAPLLPVAAGSLAPLPITGEIITQQVLENLTRKGLVQRRQSVTVTRYELLDTLREFAHEQCQQAGEWDRVAATSAEFFLTQLAMYAADIYTEQEAATFNLIEAELPNVRQSCDWQVNAAPWVMPAQAITTLSRFWTVRGYYMESRERLNRLLLHPQLPELARAELLNSLGLTEWQMGHLPEACVCFAAALELFLGLGAVKSAAMTSINLGGVMVDQETETAVAENHLQNGLTWARQIGYERAMAIGLNNLALLATARGELDQARTLLQECLALRRKLGDLRGVGITLNNLGDVEAHENNLVRARALYAESLEIRAELGDQRGALIPLLNLAYLWRMVGNWPMVATILGFSAATQSRLGIRLAPDAYRAEAEMSAAARTALSATAFARAWEVGSGLDVADVRRVLLDVPVVAFL